MVLPGIASLSSEAKCTAPRHQGDNQVSIHVSIVLAITLITCSTRYLTGITIVQKTLTLVIELPMDSMLALAVKCESN